VVVMGSKQKYGRSEVEGRSAAATLIIEDQPVNQKSTLNLNQILI